MTMIPCLSFPGFSLTRKPQVGAVPSLAWGKVLEDGDCTLLPFSVDFDHTLADRLPIARFVAFIEEEARELAGSFAQGRIGDQGEASRASGWFRAMPRPYKPRFLTSV